MSPLFRTSLALLACTTALLGCGGDQPFEPRAVDVEPSFARGAGTDLIAPSSASAAGASASEIELAWQDNSTNESRFEIYRSSDGVNGSYSLVASPLSNVTTHRDGALAAATQYCYMVRASRTKGKTVTYSAFSSVVCARTLPAPAYNLKVNPSGGSDIIINWSAFGTSFRIEKSIDSGARWSVDGTVFGERYFVAAAQGDQLTCFRVINFNESGEAAPSNTVCTTRPIAPSGVSIVAVDAETLELKWSDNSSVEESYDVWLMIDQYSCGDGHSGIFSYELRLAILPPSTTSYRAAGVLGEDVCGSTTWFEVRAMKDGSYTGTAYTIDP